MRKRALKLVWVLRRSQSGFVLAQDSWKLMRQHAPELAQSATLSLNVRALASKKPSRF